MDTSILDNPKTFTKKYILTDIPINITVDKHPFEKGWVRTNIFRKKQILLGQYVELDNFTKVEEFYSEIDYIVNWCKNKQLGPDTFIDALVDIIKAHVARSKRIIDVDIESYIDSALHIASALTTSLKLQKLEGEQLREDYRETLFYVFQKFLFVTKRDGVKAELIRWTDLMNEN